MQSFQVVRLWHVRSHTSICVTLVEWLVCLLKSSDLYSHPSQTSLPRKSQSVMKSWAKLSCHINQRTFGHIWHLKVKEHNKTRKTKRLLASPICRILQALTWSRYCLKLPTAWSDNKPTVDFWNSIQLPSSFAPLPVCQACPGQPYSRSQSDKDDSSSIPALVFTNSVFPRSSLASSPCCQTEDDLILRGKGSCVHSL